MNARPPSRGQYFAPTMVIRTGLFRIPIAVRLLPHDRLGYATATNIDDTNRP